MSNIIRPSYNEISDTKTGAGIIDTRTINNNGLEKTKSKINIIAKKNINKNY